MEWIANQPVFFGDDNGCNCDEGSYPQLSDNTDTIQVQFELSICGAEQMLQNFNEYPYNDWVLSDGWNIADELLCHNGENTTSSRIPIPVADFPLGYYQIKIVVDSFGGVGALNVQIGNIVDGLDTIGQITGVGEWLFYSTITPASNPSFPNQLNLGLSVAGVSICMSEISAYKILTNAIVAVYNSAGAFTTKLSYEEDPESFVFYQNTVTITLQWSDLSVPASNGCYYLCFLDPCLNSGGQNYSATILNPLFSGNADNWTLNGDASYFDEDIKLGYSGGEGSIFQENVFNAYINQCVYVNVTAVFEKVSVAFGDNVVGIFGSPGVYKVCGIPINSLDIRIFVEEGYSAIIEDVRPITVNVFGETIPFPTSDYTCNLQSNTFKLGDYSDSCTLLINACNNENGLGFVFGGSGFTPRLRLNAKLKGLKYNSQRVANEDSQGTKKVNYFSGRKFKNLSVDLQPEYIHDFLRLLGGFDNLYIDNNLYFVEDDEYNVEESEASDNVGSVKILVSTRTQDVKNTNCSGTENSCTLA